MKTLSATERFLFGRTRASMRGVAAVPGGIALLFLGHAIEDAGLLGAAPYIVIALVSASYILRPTVVAWVVLFAVFASYGVIVAGLHDNGSPGEWVLFMLLGLVPAALMWVARPRGSSSMRSEARSNMSMPYPCNSLGDELRRRKAAAADVSSRLGRGEGGGPLS